MYMARFSYEVLPTHRQVAIDFIRKEVAAAKQKGKQARLLVPLTRACERQPGAAVRDHAEEPR